MQKMTNGAVAEFMEEAISRATADEAVSGNAAEQLRALASKREAYGKVLGLSQKSSQTDKIKECDKIRGKNYSALKQAVRLFAKIYDGEQLAAAERLQQLLKDYGIKPTDNLRKETGELTNLNAELAGKYAADVETLALTKVVETMTGANSMVSALLLERDNANADRVPGVTRAARNECEAAYRELASRVNALAIIDGGHDYTAFIDGMNEQIEQYRKQVITKRKPRKKTQTQQAADSGGSQPAAPAGSAFLQENAGSLPEKV